MSAAFRLGTAAAVVGSVLLGLSALPTPSIANPTDDNISSGVFPIAPKPPPVLAPALPVLRMMRPCRLRMPQTPFVTTDPEPALDRISADWNDQVRRFMSAPFEAPSYDDGDCEFPFAFESYLATIAIAVAVATAPPNVTIYERDERLDLFFLMTGMGSAPPSPTAQALKDIFSDVEVIPDVVPVVGDLGGPVEEIL